VNGKDVAQTDTNELGNVIRCYSDMNKHEEKYTDWDTRGSYVARVIMTIVTPEIY
jgi:hypothetical protein